MKTEFEHLGFHIDYLYRGKYMGSIKVEKADREQYGYQGRETKLLEADVTLSNGKVLKENMEVVTELWPLCGNVKNNPFKKVNHV